MSQLREGDLVITDTPGGFVWEITGSHKSSLDRRVTNLEASLVNKSGIENVFHPEELTKVGHLPDLELGSWS